jgi:hypothetical protein
VRDISDEAVIEVDIGDRVKVDSNSLSADEIGAGNFDILGAADVEGPCFGSMNNRVPNVRVTSLSSAFKADGGVVSVLLRAV